MREMPSESSKIAARNSAGTALFLLIDSFTALFR
jgi:hypothetical protein